MAATEALQYDVERTIWLIDEESESTVFSIRAVFKGASKGGELFFSAGFKGYYVPGHAFLTEYEALVALHGRLQAQTVELEDRIREVEEQLVATGRWKKR